MLNPNALVTNSTTWTARRIALVLAVASSLPLLSGCARSLPAIQQSGDWHYAQGQYDAAQAEYLEYLDRKPSSPQVQHMLGKTYLAQGETGLARERLLLAHAMRMEDDDIFASLAEGLYQDKKFDDLNRLLRARTIDRGRMQDWALLATYAEKLGDRDEAQRGWLTAAQVDGGKSYQPQLGLAKLYLSVGDISRARRRAAMAYYADPTNGEVNELIKKLGEIPGPTLGIPPAESTGEKPDPALMPTAAPAPAAPTKRPPAAKKPAPTSTPTSAPATPAAPTAPAAAPAGQNPGSDPL